MLGLGYNDLVVDIRSNDATLLPNFHNVGHRLLGIEPTDVRDIANGKAFRRLSAISASGGAGQARAWAGERGHGGELFRAYRGRACHRRRHRRMLAPNGVFISDRITIGLLDTLQYDTVYHEHLRYYSVASLKHLWRCTISRCSTRGRFEPRRLDPRLCRAPWPHRAGQRAAHAGGEPRGKAMTAAWPLQARRCCRNCGCCRCCAT